MADPNPANMTLMGCFYDPEADTETGKVWNTIPDNVSQTVAQGVILYTYVCDESTYNTLLAEAALKDRNDVILE